MAAFNALFKVLQRKAPNVPAGLNSAPQSSASITPQPPTLSQVSKSLTALERQMQAEQAAQARLYRSAAVSAYKKPRLLSKLMWTVALVGVPATIVWFVNLPYPVIRRPVARTAPILLLPSYISIDSHYRQAIASVQQAQQLIEQATSPADLDLGAQHVAAAQKHLDALPVTFLTDYPAYSYWWYDWRFSTSQFNSSRAKIGELQAKLFQEQNAQTALVNAEQALNMAKQQYQQASTSTDKQLAIAAWQAALDQLEQIPGQTLAGRTVEPKRNAYQRDFETVVGLAADNERVSTMIEAARQFAWQAAQASQNPPHSSEEWQRVITLWQEAIDRLERIPSDDLTGYAEAQRILSRYKTDQTQIRIRQQVEADSVRALQQAKSEIQSLQAMSNGASPEFMLSQLQGIIDQLEQVQDGTTAYLEAQQLLIFAGNKLNQLQP